MCRGRVAGSCEAAAGPGPKHKSGGNDCKPRAAAELRAWAPPHHLRGGSSAITGPLRRRQHPMWNKRCLWLAVCGSLRHVVLNPHIRGSRAGPSTACGHLHPCPRVSLLPGCFCICPMLPRLAHPLGHGGFGRGLCTAGEGGYGRKDIGRVPSVMLCDPCLVLKTQPEAGAGFPPLSCPPPASGKAWSGGWRCAQMWAHLEGTKAVK